MIFKEIYLYPELSDYGKDINFPFKEQTRSLCNYLEKYIKSEKYQTTNFKRVCFVGRKNPKKHDYVNSCNVLEVEFFLDEKIYLNTPKNQLNEYFISLLLTGLSKCTDEFSLPCEKIVEGIEEFKKAGYKNEWILKKKKIKGTKIECHLKCRFTIEKLFLYLFIFNKDSLVFEKNIVTDFPNEFVFNYHLKDLKVTEQSQIEVVDKLDKVIFSMNVNDIK